MSEGRSRTLAIALILAPFAVLVAWHWRWHPGAAAGDFAQYLLHARALLEGRSYTDIGYIYNPEISDIGPRAYPPGLPIALMPIVALGGVHSPALRVFTVACMALFGVFAWLRLSKAVGTPVAAAGSSLALLAIEAQFGTLAPMSDPPFCAILWGLFLVADTGEPWNWRRTVVVTLLGFWLISFRLAGVVIIPALLLFAIARRKSHRALPFVPVLVWMASGLAAVALGVAGNPYDHTIRNWFLDIGTRVAQLRSIYGYALFDAELYPFASNRANDIYHLVATPLLLLGAVILVRRLWMSLVMWFTVCYVGVLVVVEVGDVRYLWPLLPVLCASLVQGIASAYAFARRAVRGHESDAHASWRAVIVPTLIMTATLARHSSVPEPFAIIGSPDGEALFAWLRGEMARTPVRAMFHNPRMLTLEAGVPAMGLLRRTTPGQLVAIDARRISHFVWQRPELGGCTQRQADALPEEFPDRFALAYANDTYRVYRVIPAATPYNGPYERLTWANRASGCQVQRSPSSDQKR